MIEHLAPQGHGSPLHIHTREDEWFYVLEGELTFWVDGQVSVAPAGSFVFGPKGLPHTFIVSSEMARFLLVTEPAGFERFTRALGQPAERPRDPPAGDGPTGRRTPRETRRDVRSADHRTARHPRLTLHPRRERDLMNLQQAELERIDRARAIHVAAVNDGDANAWTACFITNAVQMPPNQPPNIGTERILEWAEGFLAAFRADFSIVARDVELPGPDWAFERGSYDISLTPRAGGDLLRDSGKYLTVYRRARGHEWLMAHDIWNSDNPPPSPAAVPRAGGTLLVERD